MALMETIQDDFDFGGLDPVKWSVTNSQVVISGTNLDLEMSSVLGGNYVALASNDTYSLIGSYAFIQVTDVGNQSITSWEVYPIYLIANSNNKIFIRITGGVIQCQKVVAGVTTNIGSGLTYNSAVHKWFRIRELAGRTYFEYATDPTGTWTEITSNIANVITLTALTAEVLIGTWQAESLTSTAKFDNFNVLPGGLQFSWGGYIWNKRVHNPPTAADGKPLAANVVLPNSTNVQLQITNPSNSPFSSEFYSAQRGWGYGTYTVTIEGEVDQIETPITVGGMFTFDFTRPPAYAEIDMGETKQYSSFPNIQTLYNHTYNNNGSNTFITDNADAPPDRVRTYQTIWAPTYILFKCFRGEDTNGVLLQTFTHLTRLPTPDKERVHFNLWVPNNSAAANAVAFMSIALRNFSFVPYVAPSNPGYVTYPTKLEEVF